MENLSLTCPIYMLAPHRLHFVQGHPLHFMQAHRLQISSY